MGLHPPLTFAIVLMVFFAAKAVWLVSAAIRARALRFAPGFAALIMSLAVAGFALALNFLSPGVHWVSFRHYQGYALFWGVALWQFPFGSEAFHRRFTIPALAVLAAVAEIYYAYRLVLVYPL